jgi:hypothetical protein
VITVSGNQASRVFNIGAGFTVDISGIAVADGRPTNDSGGGIWNSGTLNLTSATVSGNSAGGYSASGGGIFNGGTLSVTNCILSDNSAFGFNEEGYRIGFGGGIFNTARLTVTNSALSGNGDSYGGGGIWNDPMGTVTLTSATLSGNSVENRFGTIGGAIWNDGTLTVTNSTLSNNAAFGGIDWGSSAGGIANLERGTLTVTNSTLSGNGASYGGGIVNVGVLNVTNSTLNGNDAHIGGGINNAGALTLTSSTVSGNSGLDGGGGISNSGTMSVTSSTVSDNRGSGISNWPMGTLTVTNSALSGNSANATYAGGGGISNEGSLTVTNSTLSGNSAFNGGGIYSVDGTVTVTNSTLSGNSARGGGGNGGGISTFRGALTVLNCTLSGNSADGSGGGISNEGTLYTRNTIIAGNTASAGRDLYGNIGSQGYNLIGNTQGGSGFADTDLLNVNPLLGPLQNNGGPTQTMALLAGSPALNAGDPNELGVPDQRGVVRSGGVNIGAYQASADHLVFLQQPADTAAGQTMAAVIVQVVDPFGNAAIGDNTHTVTLSIGNNPSGGTLSGTLTLTVSGGIATFSDLSIDLSGNGYTLHASVGGSLPDIDSNPFNITP